MKKHLWRRGSFAATGANVGTHTPRKLLNLDGLHGASLSCRPDAIFQVIGGLTTGRVTIHPVLLNYLAGAFLAFLKELRTIGPAGPAADAFFLVDGDLEHRRTSFARIKFLTAVWAATEMLIP